MQPPFDDSHFNMCHRLGKHRWDGRGPISTNPNMQCSRNEAVSLSSRDMTQTTPITDRFFRVTENLLPSPGTSTSARNESGRHMVHTWSHTVGHTRCHPTLGHTWCHTWCHPTFATHGPHMVPPNFQDQWHYATQVALSESDVPMQSITVLLTQVESGD